MARDTDHELLIGSRDPETARAAVERYERALAGHGTEASLDGFANGTAADRAAVVVCGVPAYHLVDTVESVADRLDGDAILVSPAVGMKREEGTLRYNRPSAGSVTRRVGDAAPEAVSTIGTFYTLAAVRLANVEADLATDVLVVGDDAGAKATVRGLAAGIDGLSTLDAGPLGNAPQVERLAALLDNLAHYNDDLVDAGVRFE